MYKRILLPLDGSAMAEQALPYAIAQAERFQAELILLKVIPPLVESRSPQTEERARKLVCKELTPAATRAQEHGIPTEIVCTESGRPYLSIIKYADTNQVDLIVMCTHGYSGISRWLLGSVADRVVKGANVPVLLVRAQENK